MIVGNAVFTMLVLVLLVGGGALVFGKSRFEAPGPLQEDKIVNIPPRSGMMEIADLLNREGVVDEHRLVFIGGVFALKARSELKAGEYLFPKARQRARRRRDDRRRARWCSISSPFPRA